MITLYTWATPNGKKISILLEELGQPFKAVPIDIGKGDQFARTFSRSALTTKSRPWWTAMDPMASPSRCLSPVPSCSTWQARQVVSSARRIASVTRSCSG